MSIRASCAWEVRVRSFTLGTSTFLRDIVSFTFDTLNEFVESKTFWFQFVAVFFDFKET